MKRHHILAALAALTAGFVFSAIAQEPSNSASSPSATAPASVPSQSATPAATHSSKAATAAAEAGFMERSLRIEGEKRFRSNCGRCHMAPHKFPPRVMATAIRHMRVRAMITEEDMRLILRYMTQ